MKINPYYRVTYTGDADIDAILEQCLRVLQSKGADYTVGSSDKLANFKRSADFTGLTPQQAWSVYFYKHVAAIFSYVKTGGQAESEPIEGRIVDAINYLLLFGKMVAETKRREAVVAVRSD